MTTCLRPPQSRRPLFVTFATNRSFRPSSSLPGWQTETRTMSKAVNLPLSNMATPVVRRTRASLDSDISPFVLDPSSVTLQRKLSSSQYEAMYLFTPATVTRTQTHADTLRICEYLDHLRHPHLEQFIGVVTDSMSRSHMVVTAQRQGHLLADFLSPKCVDGLRLHDVLQIARQSSLALHYLHQTTMMGHHGLCAHSIVYSMPRGKAVVLLTTECKICHPSPKKPSRHADVATVTKLVLKLLRQLDSPPLISNKTDSERVVATSLSLHLRQIVRVTTMSRATTPRTAADLCKVFAEAANQLV